MSPTNAGVCRPWSELVLGVAEPPDLVERQVDAAPLGVRTEVAHDVRELERDPQVHRVVPRPGVRVAEDLDAGQADRRRHPVAVLVELLERGVAPLVDVHLDAVEDRLEVLALDGEGPDHLGEMLGDRLRRAAVVGARRARAATPRGSGAARSGSPPPGPRRRPPFGRRHRARRWRAASACGRNRNE